MHTSGHIGASLLTYSPVGATLIYFNHPIPAVLGLATAFSFAMLPDIDMRLQSILPIKHRGVTHTVWFTLGVLVVGGLVSHSPVGLGVIFAIGVYTGVHQYVPFLNSYGTFVQYAVSITLGVLVWGVSRSVSPTFPHVELFIGSVAALSVASHLLSDALTPTGVTLFYPLRSQTYTLGFVRASNQTANYLLFTVGIIVTCVTFVLAFNF